MATKRLDGWPQTALADFLAVVNQRFEADEPDTFWNCEEAFRALAQTALDREALNAGLAQVLESTNFAGEWGANEFVLHQGGGTALIVSSNHAPQRYIHALPYHALYAVLGSDSVPYARHTLPSAYENEVFNPALKLTQSESSELRPGNSLQLPCGQHAFDFQFQKHTLMLKFVTSAILPLEWLFKRDTLQAWQANDADLSFTQLRVAADVLGKIAHQSSINPLKLMSHHGHHAVRWAAITNLGRINRSEAISRLQEALEDPHPHIRRAAAKTLQKLGPQ